MREIPTGLNPLDIYYTTAGNLETHDHGGHSFENRVAPVDDRDGQKAVLFGDFEGGQEVERGLLVHGDSDIFHFDVLGLNIKEVEFLLVDFE